MGQEQAEGVWLVVWLVSRLAYYILIAVFPRPQLKYRWNCFVDMIRRRGAWNWGWKIMKVVVGVQTLAWKIIVVEG